MRKFERNNILELLATIKESLEYAITVDESAANAVLGDGLDALGAVAEMLEQVLSPDGFSKYSPIMYGLIGAFDLLLTDIDDIKVIDETLDNIFSLFDKLSENMNNEREIKTEVVFFPYKAPMWDSMESIWAAAKQDESCFVTVVPAPYFERDKAGGLSKAYYDGNDFPEYVEVTPADEFDIQAVLPDIAYIHNPYDEHNYVTSVHPDFYSYALKRHVKTLVYVPYYASHTPSSASLATVAAELRVDTIIAASEDDAASYKRAGARCEIAIFGSPKIDKIINLEMQKPEIPAQWSSLEGKKVFFLNTSIGSLLRYGEGYLSKIGALISLFETRSDAALLWRPHPLIASTLSSMRPDLQQAYMALEQMAENSSSAIIDKTPDMGISMAISDAYIGDGASSLVYLYALTGKPLYILNFTLPIAPTDEQLSELSKTDLISGPCIDGDEAWVFCNNVNALCKLDLKTGNAEFVSSVPGEPNTGGRYSRSIKCGSKLILSPSLASEWAEYDIQTGEWAKHPIPAEALPLKKNGISLFFALDTDDFAIFAPYHSKAFVKYDKKTREFEYHTAWYKSFEPYIFNMAFGLISGASKLIGNCLYLPSKQSNIVLELNVHSMKTKIHKVGPSSNRYFGITFDGEHFWLTKFLAPGMYEPQNTVVRWNKGTRQCKEYALEPTSKNSVREISDFVSIAYFGGKVWVFPYGVSEIFQIDPATDEVALVETGLPYRLGDKKNPFYSSTHGMACVAYSDYFDDDYFIVFSYYDNSFLFFDTETGSIRKQKLHIEGIEHLLRNMDALPPYTKAERAFLTSADYVDRICSGSIPAFDPIQAEYNRSINANSDGTCGQKIHSHFMKKLR